MFNQRPLNARGLLSKAGIWPKAGACVAALSLLGIPANALAQPAPDASKPRDPMKAGKDKDAKVVVSEHMTVDLHVKDEDLSNVLELLSIQTQKNIIASKNVGGKVTATLYGVTFYQALDAILHVNGFGYTENGNFIYVYTKEELAQIQAALKKKVSKVIKLNYLNAEDAKEFVSPLLSKEGGEIKVNSKVAAFNIPDKAPVGKNDFALTDTLVVIDFEENVKAIEELVKQIDTRPAQVLVEATILQTSLNEANAFGVDFSIIGDLNFTDFINIGGPLGAAAGLIKGGTGAAGQGFSPPNDRGNAITSTVGNTQGPGGFKVGVMAGDVGIFLRMLDQVTDTVILSNPKILALNRQPARVLVGKRVGYLNTTTTDTSTTQSVEFLDTGTQLYFRPFVSSEGEIRMELKPQVSAAEIRNITDARGSVVTIPDETTQELVTNVNVRDGQTVVLGGLFTENTTFTRRQVPWAGDLPIIGNAFRGKEDSTIRSEIIFLITPSIVTDTMLAGAADRAGSDIERIRTGTRQGLLPWSREKMTETLNVEAEKLAREGNSDRALWNLQRSLSLNPNQPEAYRLREKITGERETWENASRLSDIIGGEKTKRQSSIPSEATPPKHRKPWGSTNFPREVVQPSAKPTTSNTPTPTPVAQTEFTPIMVPGQGGNAPAWAEPSANAGSTNAETPANAQSTGPTLGQTFAPSPNATAPTTATTNVAGTNVTTRTEVIDGEEVTFVTASSTPIATTNAASTPAPAPTDVSSITPEPSMPTPSLVELPSSVKNPGEFNTSFSQPASDASVLAPTTAPAATTTAAAANTEPKPDGYTVPNLNDQEKSQVAEIHKTLPGLRGHIELFSLMNSGTKPELGGNDNDGWKSLVDANLIKNVPANTYVGGENARKVVIAEKPDNSFHANYGWIYNPKTGQLWAAGFDSSDRPLVKPAANGAVANQAPGSPAPSENSPPSPSQANVDPDQK